MDILKNSITGGITNLGDRINDFFDNLPENIVDGITSLFTPTVSLSDRFVDLKDSFTSKLPLIEDVRNIYEGFIGMFQDADEQMPVFEMSHGGTAYRIIDFSMFDAYRIYIHGIILAFAYIGYIRKTFYRLHSLIHGVGDIGSMVQD